MRSLAHQSYSTAYKNTNIDIEIEEEKIAKINIDQLEGLGRKENEPYQEMPRLRRRTTTPRAVDQEAGSPLTSLNRGHPNISVVGCNFLAHQPWILGKGMTRHTIIHIHTYTVVELADQRHRCPLQLRMAPTGKWSCT